MINYVLIFLLSLILAIVFTLIIKKLASRFDIVDQPGERKIHLQAVPLLGGVAIFVAFFVSIFIFSQQFLAGNLEMRHLLGFFIGSLVLIIGGVLDDKYNLPAKIQIIFPLLAILAIILGGVQIEKITNPFGGLWQLSEILWLGPILILLWLMGMMYTTKLLDGVDGLVTGIGVIGSLIIFLFTITTKYYQPDIALAAMALVGAGTGFLIFNFHPAKIFLGEGGSLFFGFALGVLAIISGGKIAIALLIMGIPILDVIWTIVRRMLQGKNPFKFADKKHLHHRLLHLGLSQKQTVFIFYFFSLAFGASGLFLQSKGKLLALFFLVVLMLAGIFCLSFLDRRRELKKPSLLLHISCSPCGAYITQSILLPRYRVTWLFYNPNLNTLEEYEKRLASVQLVAKKLKIPVVVIPYDHKLWVQKIKGHEQDPERGARCVICYLDRLRMTAKMAVEKKFDFFGTTLLVSPYKDADTIYKLAQDLELSLSIKFLPDKLQTRENYSHSQELAKQLGIYRQKFCGCEYSISQK